MKQCADARAAKFFWPKFAQMIDWEQDRHEQTFSTYGQIARRCACSGCGVCVCVCVCSTSLGRCFVLAPTALSLMSAWGIAPGASHISETSAESATQCDTVTITG